MKELLRNNDPVRLSWLTALLADRGIQTVVLDSHMSVLEGSVPAIYRRLMVDDEDFEAARKVLAEAGEIESTEGAETADRLLGGRVLLRQPEKGYRVAIDTVLLAAAVPAVADRVLDLGCGVGAAALCYARRVPGAHVVGIDKDAELVRLAIRNAAENELGDRTQFLCGDVREAVNRLGGGNFAHVMFNPPFMSPERGGAPLHPTKAEAAVEGAAGLGVWIDAALRLVAAKGSVTFIHRADRLDEILALLHGRAGGIVVFPLWPYPGKAAKRVLVRARRGVKTPTRLAAGLVLHREGGGYTEAAEEVLRRGAALAI